MSVLSVPFVASTIARLMQPAMSKGFRLPDDVTFSEIPASTEEIAVPTRHGDVRVIVYGPPPSVDVAGVFVNFHGGAYIMRFPEQDDAWCRYLAHHAGVTVVNVDYDVAPQARFPIPVEEGYDVAVWAASHTDWDGSRLAVGGQSAGGAIAAAVARLAHERGAPSLTLELIHYAPLDLATRGREKRLAGPPSIISVPMTEIADSAYVPDRAQRTDRLVSPAWHENLTGLAGIAPAVVVTCEHDRLRDEGIRYANALREAGALVEHIEIPGADHGYNLMKGERAIVEPVYVRLAAHVRSAIGDPS